MVSNRPGAGGRGLAVATALALLAAAPGCGKDDCRTHTSTVCEDGVTHWVDGCGEREEKKQDCYCGCDDEGVDCLACTCLCHTTDVCCDGCLAINWGGDCEDGDDATEDDFCLAGTCSAGSPVIAEPAAPVEPEAPEAVALTSWTCPQDWSAVSHDSLLDDAEDPFSWCEPPALPRLTLADGYITPLEQGEQEGDRPVCDPAVAGTYPVLGRADCQRLGDPCPQGGEWPQIPGEIEGARIHVRQGATGGDGSQGLPYGSINEAVAAAAAGDVVVIAAGAYAESVVLDRELTLWGACVEQTAIEGPEPYAPDSAAVVVTEPVTAGLRNLRISGGSIGVLAASADSEVTLDGVWIHQATGTGLAVRSARAAVRGSLISATLADPNGSGRGATVETRGRLELESVTLERNRVVGIEASNVSTLLQLLDVAVRNTQGNASTRSLGQGVQARSGAVLEASRLLVHGNREAGLSIGGSGTKATLEDLIVRRTESEESSRAWGEGLWAENGAKVFVTRGLFENNRSEGIMAHASLTLVELTDVIVRDTRSEESSGEFGEGLWIQEGADARLANTLLEGNRDMGIRVGEAGGTLELDGVVVQDTQSEEATLESGVGLWVEFGAEVTGGRLLLDRNRFIGLLVSQDGSLVDLTDVTVRDTLYQEKDGQFGQGLQVSSQGALVLQRALFEHNHNYGLMVANRGTIAELSDVTVRHTQAQLSDETAGGGLALIIAGQATIRRGLFDNNRTVGLVAYDSDSLLDLEDLTVRDTQHQLKDWLFGRGLDAQRGAEIRVRRGLLERNLAIGISGSGRNTALDLEDVTVRETLAEMSTKTGGEGLWVADGVQVSLARGVFEDNQTTGVLARGSDTVLELEDVVVRGTGVEALTGHFGYGLWIYTGAQLTLTRALLEQNHSCGFGASERDTVAVLQDVMIRDTKSDHVETCRGYGMQVDEGARVTMKRGWFLRNRTGAIFVMDLDTRVEFEDLLVRDTLSRELLRDYGRGLGVDLGAQVTVNRGLFLDNRSVGAGVWFEESILTLNDVAVINTMDEECAGDPFCPGHGVGVGAWHGAVLVVSGVEVADSKLAGLQLAWLGSAMGEGLWIHDNVIGANIQDVPEGYDLFEAVVDLQMADNEINFDSTALSVPVFIEDDEE